MNLPVSQAKTTKRRWARVSLHLLPGQQGGAHRPHYPIVLRYNHLRPQDLLKGPADTDIGGDSP